MRNSTLLCCALLALCPPTLNAQKTLDQAEQNIADGALADARALLQRWQKDNPNAARAQPEQQARYHMLLARTFMAADSAEDHYLTVALNYPTSTFAPEALLRLAQARTLRGDTAQAVAYLQRLLADYPKSDRRSAASDWLARIQPASAKSAQVSAPARTQPAATPARNTASPAATARSSEDPKYAIQVGAFRELSGARSMQRQLEQAGFNNVRLVRVPANSLIRVRIGKYARSAEAAPLIARLKEKNFAAVLVTDANTESSVK